MTKAPNFEQNVDDGWEDKLKRQISVPEETIWSTFISIYSDK